MPSPYAEDEHRMIFELHSSMRFECSDLLGSANPGSHNDAVAMSVLNKFCCIPPATINMFFGIAFIFTVNACSTGSSGVPIEDDPSEYSLQLVKYIAMDQEEIKVEGPEGNDVTYRIVVGQTKYFDFWCNPVRVGHLLTVLRIGSAIIIETHDQPITVVGIRPGRELGTNKSGIRLCSKKPGQVET